MNILGISAFYHDSSAALIKNGDIIAAAQEERFTRKKHDSSFPINAIRYCIQEAGIRKNQLDTVVFYEKPFLKFHRLLQTYFGIAPRGIESFLKAVPLWFKQKLWIPMHIENGLEKLGVDMPKKLLFTEHHQSHCASAFFPSPYRSAAILTSDGVGEWTTSSIAHGKNNELKIIRQLNFPHSLGLLYSAFTYFTGFKVNSGEYKLMGLAPFGKPVYVNLIYDNLLDLKDDGSFRLNMDYFGYLDSLKMTNSKFNRLFGGSPRKPESEITTREMDMASSIQAVTEDILLKMANHAYHLTGEKKLCLGGGTALNCVANGKIQQEGPFDDIWIQPAAGDAGGALGAALFVWHQLNHAPRKADELNDTMKGAYLGPCYSDNYIADFINSEGIQAKKLTKNEIAPVAAKLLDEHKVIGLFSGRMEYGPRALGARSIIGDARSAKMQSLMNQKIKFRESFRPFAPSCLLERVSDYFELSKPSPYMLLVSNVTEKIRKPVTRNHNSSLCDIINEVRSSIPAVTHVDYSARIQTVDGKFNKLYYDILKAFEDRTGCGVIINTSFNVRGEPIVCTPEDACACFMSTGIDCLLLGPYLIMKNEQPDYLDGTRWKHKFILD